MTAEPWRYRCPVCGSVVLHPRTRLGGYRCRGCGGIHSARERVDARAEA